MSDALGEESAFWEFSLALYARTGVEEACLALQDEHGLDVNLALLCCFLGRHGVKLEEAGLSPLIRQSKAWSETILQPLRHLRRRLKTDPVGAIGPTEAQATRRAIQAAELEAEKAQQHMLYRVLAVTPGRDARAADRAGLARLNLATYAAASGLACDTVLRGRFEVLIRGMADDANAPDSADPTAI